MLYMYKVHSYLMCIYDAAEQYPLPKKKQYFQVFELRNRLISDIFKLERIDRDGVWLE